MNGAKANGIRAKIIGLGAVVLLAAAVGLGALPAHATLDLKARDFQAVYGVGRRCETLSEPA